MKKETPSPRGGISIASAIAVITGLTSIIIFLTGKSSLPDIILGETATATPTATQSESLPPSPTLTLTPPDDSLTVLAPIHTETALVARMPSDSDIETVPSIWTLTNFRELTKPSSNAYTIELTHDSVWLWNCYFCNTNEAFQEFFTTLELGFWIDGTQLEEQYLRVYDVPGIKGWLCRNWSTVLSNWPQDRSVFLEIRYTHTRPTTDGRDDFEAGEYSQTIIVVVRG